MRQFITKANLHKWLEGMSASRRLIAPTTDQDGLTLFRQVKTASQIDFAARKTAFSAKEFFFPLSEVLFTVVRTDGRLSVQPTTVEPETVIFGMRPCDALGVALLDRPFMSAPTDTLYKQHRDKTTLVGVGCSVAGKECFCTSMGTSPHDSRHLDVLLIEAGDGYLVEPVTEKGKVLLREAQLEDRDTEAPRPPEVASAPAVGLQEAARAVFSNPYWDRLADRCIHCNVCAAVCSCCYCFDVRDYRSGGNVERVRCWESCQSPGFTRIAGGYDPRAKKGPKLRQRFYHKFLYFPEQFDGVIDCTGCGRCVVACPVNIDIREVITEMARLAGAPKPEAESAAAH